MDMVIFESGMSEQEQIAVLMEVESEKVYRLCVLSSLATEDRPLASAYQSKVLNYYRNNKIPHGLIVPPHILHVSLGYFPGTQLMQSNFAARLRELNFSIALPYVDTVLIGPVVAAEFGDNSAYKDILSKLKLTAMKFTHINRIPHMTICKEVNVLPPEEIILDPGFNKLRFQGLTITAADR
jgi:hypothetical protein